MACEHQAKFAALGCCDDEHIKAAAAAGLDFGSLWTTIQSLLAQLKNNPALLPGIKLALETLASTLPPPWNAIVLAVLSQVLKNAPAPAAASPA